MMNSADKDEVSIVVRYRSVLVIYLLAALGKFYIYFWTSLKKAFTNCAIVSIAMCNLSKLFINPLSLSMIVLGVEKVSVPS